MNLVRSLARATRHRAFRVAYRIALASVVAFAAHAAEVPLTLDAAIERALREAPRVVAAQSSLEGAQAFLLSAGRLPDPELIVGVDNLPINRQDGKTAIRSGLNEGQSIAPTCGTCGQLPPTDSKEKLQFEQCARSLCTTYASSICDPNALNGFWLCSPRSSIWAAGRWRGRI